MCAIIDVQQIYTGQPPFAEHSDATVMFMVLTGERPVRPTTGTGIPAQMWEIVVSCWADDPRDRPHIDRIVKAVCRMETELEAAEHDGHQNYHPSSPSPVPDGAMIRFNTSKTQKWLTQVGVSGIQYFAIVLQSPFYSDCALAISMPFVPSSHATLFLALKIH